MAIRSLSAPPESSSTPRETLGLQERPILGKKLKKNITTRLEVEVHNLLLHLQRNIICILSV